MATIITTRKELYLKAMQTKGEERKNLLQQVLSLVTDIETVQEGPGTELKKSLSWLWSPKKRKCKCLNRIQKMNKWGPDVCEQKIHTILRWMRHSARINRVPYIELAVKLVVLRAINNSRKKLQLQ